MSREIKFRVWDKENKEMYYTVNTLKNNSIMEMLINFDSIGASVFVSGYGREDTKEVKDFELMQCTGLKDKNGTEIYEGDILEYDFREKGHKELLIVRWSDVDGMWLFGYVRSEYAIRYGKVIGSIHDSPELLESEVE